MASIYKSAEAERLICERYREFLKRWPVPNRQFRVPTRQGETFVIACGPEDAPPLVLLHGAMVNAGMWIADVAAWAEHFRVYAIDVIGEPGLSAPSRPPLSSEAYTLWLDDVLQALTLQHVSLVGASLGGWLALDYATRRPERVDSAVLLCPAGVGRQKRSFLFKALPLMLLGDWGRRKAVAIAVGPPPANVPPAHTRFAEFMSFIGKHFIPRRGPVPIFDDAALKRLTMPVLVILGGRDAILDSAETKLRMERAVPHASVVVLPEAGHGLRGQTASILKFLQLTTDASLASRSR
jgi:pimeloyl-ACP methyl ester carboxylesterase